MFVSILSILIIYSSVMATTIFPLQEFFLIIFYVLYVGTNTKSINFSDFVFILCFVFFVFLKSPDARNTRLYFPQASRDVTGMRGMYI